MARPQIVSIAPAAVDADGICLSQTRASAGALTLDGVLAGTTLDFSRKIDFISGANIVARVFTIVGTDANGRAITETVTGINNNTVQTTKYYSTVSSISVDASFSANTITVGTSDDIATKIYPLNHYDNVAAQVTVELVSGSATWSVQETYSALDSSADEVWIVPTAHSGKTATLTAPLDLHANACRLVTSTFSTPVISFNIYQSGSE